MKKRPRVKEIDSQKTVIVIFTDKDNPKSKQMGMVEDFKVGSETVIVKVKPLVIEARFEGEPVQFAIRGKEIGKWYEEVLKKFGSSPGKVLLLEGRRATAFKSEEGFNKFLEAMLRRMKTKEYVEELHRSAKKGYVV